MILLLNKKIILESYLQDLMDGVNNEDAVSRNGEDVKSFVKKESILDKSEKPLESASKTKFLKDKYPLFNHNTLSMIDKDLNDHSKNRVGLSLGKATDNSHKFFDKIGNIESDMRPDARNSDSTASGLYQQTEPNAKTADNRLDRDYKQVARNTNIHEKLKAFGHDARSLNTQEQTNLAYANLSGHGNGKYYFHGVLDGNEKLQEKVYNEMHHTNPDKATYNRVDKFFKKGKG